MSLGFVFGLDVSLDGSVVVGSSGGNVIAHSTATGDVLWQKEMAGDVWSLCIYGVVVIVPVDDSETLVLTVATGHQLHTLPSAGEDVRGICVFDGLKSDTLCFVKKSQKYNFSSANEVCIEGG